MQEGSVLRSAEGDAHRAEASRGYLRHVRMMCYAAARIKSDIDEAREMLLPGAVCYDSQPGSPNAYGDAIPDGIGRLHELIAEYSGELAEMASERHEAKRALDRLSDPRGGYALSEHYLHDEPWPEVAEAAGYSEQHVKLIARAALVELYDYLPFRYRDPRHPAI